MCVKNLCKNRNGINIIKKRYKNDDVDSRLLYYLAQNPNGLELVEKNVNKLNDYCWKILCKRKDAFYLLEKNPDICPACRS